MAYDIRYETVHCARCRNVYQLIDFHGNPHAWFCGGEPDPTDIARLMLNGARAVPYD